MKKIFNEAKDWVDEGRKIVLATVVQTWGSSPRPVGSRMIVDSSGEFSGSVSGGCVESMVIKECLILLKKNHPCKRIEFKVSNSNAWEVGLACGGEISIFLEKIT